jgi:hypothetical protein
VLAQHGARHRAADADTVGDRGDLAHGRDPLDIDHQIGLDMAGAQPDQ